MVAGGTGSGPACVTRDCPPRSGAAIFRPAGTLAKDPTPPPPHQARVPALTCLSGATAWVPLRWPKIAWRTGCLWSPNLKAENWRTALLGQTASAFPPGAEVGRGVPVPKAQAPVPLLLLPCSDPFLAREDGGGGRRQDRRRSPPYISPAARQVRW